MLFRTVSDWGVPYKLMHQESELDRSLRCLLYKVKGTFYAAHGQSNDHEVVYMELEGELGRLGVLQYISRNAGRFVLPIT